MVSQGREEAWWADSSSGLVEETRIENWPLDLTVWKSLCP